RGWAVVAEGSLLQPAAKTEARRTVQSNRRMARRLYRARVTSARRGVSDDGLGRALSAARTGWRRWDERRLARPRHEARARGGDQAAPLGRRRGTGAVAPLPPRGARARGPRPRTDRPHLRLRVERRAVVPGDGVHRRRQPRPDDPRPAPARTRLGGRP